MRFALAGILAAIALAVPAAAQAAPTLSIDDVTIAEGDSGQKIATFTVTASETSASDVTVNYGTADGTATQPGDYSGTSGVLTIPAGQTSNTVLVPVKADLLDEIDETFDLNLSSAAGATISDGRGVGTIIDDDPAPTLSIADAGRTETNGTMSFTIRLSRASGRDVSVKYATADGSARAPGDYTAATGTVTIPAGSSSRTVGIPIREDSLDEPSESFAVNLSGASGASISDSQGRGTIADDDAAPSLAIRDSRAAEGRAAGFFVALSRPSGRNITVQYATEPRSARSDVDFTASSGTLTIPVGASSGAVVVATHQDSSDEPSETFLVRLSKASNARISDSSGTATIIDDDPRPNAAPRLRLLALVPATFRAARRGGATGSRGGALVRFTLSERARVRFYVQRRVGGHWGTVTGSFVRTAHAGLNRLHFRGRIGGRRLAVARYRLVAYARDFRGARSATRRAAFRIRR